LTFERLPNRIRTKQDIETIAKRIDEFKEEDFKIEIVKFCGTTGEPLMNPLTAYAIKVFRGLGKKIILFTNGLYLDREVDGKPYYEHVLDTDKLIISLDAASEQTFYDLKGSKGFQKIISSINDIISKRNSHPRISIGYVIGDKNYHEIEEIAELMKNLGVEDIRFRVDFTIPGEVRRHSEEIMASLKRVRTSCENGFKAVPIYSEEEIGNDNNAFNSFGRKCFNQHFWACVGPDAELYACGHRTYSEVRSYGNLLEHSFRELWHSQERVRTLETLPDSLCKFCSPSSSRRNTFMTFLSQIRR
jgi:MoaA/NifB/PqqE/SkfB family radical SAM enzyme